MLGAFGLHVQGRVRLVGVSIELAVLPDLGQDSAQARYAELEDGPDVGLAMDEPGEEEREHEGGDLEP